MIQNRPCETGAEVGAILAKYTVPNQCLATTMDALKAVVERVEFHCHEKQNEGRICAGWFLLQRGDGPTAKLPWDFSDGE